MTETKKTLNFWKIFLFLFVFIIFFMWPSVFFCGFSHLQPEKLSIIEASHLQTFCCPFYPLHSVLTPNPHNSLISVIVFHCLIISHSSPHTSSLIKSREWHIAGRPRELTIYLALHTENLPQAQWSQISIAFTSPHSLPCSREYEPFCVCVCVHVSMGVHFW